MRINNFALPFVNNKDDQQNLNASEWKGRIVKVIFLGALSASVAANIYFLVRVERVLDIYRKCPPCFYTFEKCYSLYKEKFSEQLKVS